MGVKQLLESHQKRLAELGYYKLRVDGDWGPGTENAFTRFKAECGLFARPYPGPITCKRLWDEKAPPAPKAPALSDDEPLWVTEARSLLGVREVKGSGNSPVIIGWAENLDQWYPGDDTAWCGLFTAHCMMEGAPDEPQDFNRLGAREWLKYGTDALHGLDPRAAELPFGGVGVMWRTSRSHWHGHVGPAIVAQNDTHFAMIGGNQNDQVSLAWFRRDRLLGVRKPQGVALNPAPRVATGALSLSEA